MSIDLDVLEGLRCAATAGEWLDHGGVIWANAELRHKYDDPEAETYVYHGDCLINVVFGTVRASGVADRDEGDANRSLIAAAVNALPDLIAAARERDGLREKLRLAAEYLCRFEGALLADDLDMKMSWDEPSPTSFAESLLTGFDSIEYDLSRQSIAPNTGEPK